MYGLISKKHLDETIIDVCDTLGYGSNQNAHLLLAETAMAETAYGDTPDLHLFSGYGIMQFDTVAINDVIERTSQSKKDLIMGRYGIDLNKVSGFTLQWSPLASVVFARLKYQLIPEAIPNEIRLRAMYWKKYYNSALGKGTIEHYLSANENTALRF